MTDDEYYQVQWKHPIRGWQLVSEAKENENQARRQLRRAMEYYHTDIVIQLIKVSETVVEECRGSKP